MPYFYTLAWDAAQEGYPPVRPLFWADPTDSRLWDVDDAFLLGDSLLVCPIVTEGDRSRQLTLPQGHWYSFWSDRAIAGGTDVTLEAPLEQILLLVKAGTILPMEAGAQLTLHLYPPLEGTAHATLYGDAGDGYGDYRLDRFSLTRTAEGLTLTWQSEGEYGFPYADIQIQVHAMQLQQVAIDEVEVALAFSLFTSLG